MLDIDLHHVEIDVLCLTTPGINESFAKLRLFSKINIIKAEKS